MKSITDWLNVIFSSEYDVISNKYFLAYVLPLNKNLGTENVINTNFCEISVCKLKEKNKILILSALDNLVKGAGGQAIQNMNIVSGLRENLGFKWNF